MRLYLEAKSRKNIGYIPDWLQINYKENGREYDLTLDIQGSIDYSKENLSCRCKGELVPWTLYDYISDEEIDLSSLSEAEIIARFPDVKIAELICNSDKYRVGIYPIEDNDEIFKLLEDDVLSRCEALFEMNCDERFYKNEFNFETELTYL